MSKAMNKNRPGLLTKINRFMRDLRGVSAVEFAFVFPVMAVLYLGGTALTQGLVIKRKVALAARTVGDLISQDTQVIDNEKTAIFNAATAVINPYPTGQLAIIVSSVVIDAAGAATIAWSDATNNTTAHAVNSSVTLPAGITPVDANNNPIAGSTVIWAEASYGYTLPVGNVILGRTSINLADQFYLRPRRVTAIKRCTTGVCP
jgi:Flp pilus assembly protein TadG